MTRHVPQWEIATQFQSGKNFLPMAQFVMRHITDELGLM
jgi:hypothetical protein